MTRIPTVPTSVRVEYVGAPESARLLSRSLEYWLHHMGRARTLAAALQLQHDAGLISRSLGNSLPPSTGCRQRSCVWRSLGSRFRQRQCRSWCRLTVFDGWRTTWRPWACGVHRVCMGFMALCRRRLATRACPAQTAFLTYRSSGS